MRHFYFNLFLIYFFTLYSCGVISTVATYKSCLADIAIMSKGSVRVDLEGFFDHTQKDFLKLFESSNRDVLVPNQSYQIGDLSFVFIFKDESNYRSNFNLVKSYTINYIKTYCTDCTDCAGVNIARF